MLGLNHVFEGSVHESGVVEAFLDDESVLLLVAVQSVRQEEAAENDGFALVNFKNLLRNRQGLGLAHVFNVEDRGFSLRFFLRRGLLHLSVSTWVV